MQKFTLVFLILLQLSCKKKTELFTEDQHIKSGDTIRLNKSSNILPQLTLTEVTLSSIQKDFETLGTVQPIPNQYAEIAAPFPGRILKTFIKLGQQVDVGTPLFELHAPEYSTLQKEFLDASQLEKLALLNFERQKDLYANGIGILKDLEEATTNLEIAKFQHKNAKLNLNLFAHSKNGHSLERGLIVTSPIAGEVVNNNLVIGQYLKEDAPAVLQIAALEKLWIVAQIKENDLQEIHGVTVANIKTAAYANQIFKGEIFHINSIIDPETRSLEVIIALDNTDKKLKPGMFTTINFEKNTESVKTIPLKAVQQGANQSYVYLQIAPLTFVKRSIETKDLNNKFTEVLNGLEIGDQVVTQGGLFLTELK